MRLSTAERFLKKFHLSLGARRILITYYAWLLNTRRKERERKKRKRRVGIKGFYFR